MFEQAIEELITSAKQGVEKFETKAKFIRDRISTILSKSEREAYEDRITQLEADLVLARRDREKAIEAYQNLKVGTPDASHST